MRGLQPSQEDASKQIGIQWDLPLGSIANMVPRRQRELAHRTSNEFASAISVISLAAAGSANDEVKIALAAAQDRLHNYAQVHQALLMPSDSTLVDASAYLHRVCQAISRSRLDVKGIELVLVECPIQMNSDCCWRLGLMCRNGLVTRR